MNTIRRSSSLLLRCRVSQLTGTRRSPAFQQQYRHRFFSSNACTTNGKDNNDDDGEEDRLLRRPFPSHVEQFKMFPVGVKRLWSDIQTYIHIQDAASTATNCWANIPGNNYYDKRHHWVPRRQQAFQRKLIKELQSVAVPVVGYAAIPSPAMPSSCWQLRSPRFS